VLGREALGLDVPAAGTSLQVLVVAIDLALFGLEEMIFAVALSPDGKEIATASKNGTVKIWPLNSFTQRKPAEVLCQ
jgi:WD40 repeat protein